MQARAAEHGRVHTGPAVDRVVTRQTQKNVGPAVADERIGVRATHDVFDTAEDVTLRIAAGAQSALEVDCHARRRQRIVRHIHSGATDQRVGASATVKRIIARPPEQHVGSV